jgi:triosephosphate isomerase
MPHQYVIANWKMNLPPEGVEPYIRALAAGEPAGTAFVVAPPYPYLRDVSRVAVPTIEVCGQNCADHESGAFTGEVAASMLRDNGAHYVILGHSERRSLYGETDALIARKLLVARSAGLVPVLCVGEDLRTRETGHVARFLADQIRAMSEAGLEKDGEIIIAYEPIWAIGTGRTATGPMVAETIDHIRDALRRFWPARFADGAPILYGGSVTPENVRDLVAQGHINGFLVGGASLDSGKFLAIHGALSPP